MKKIVSNHINHCFRSAKINDRANSGYQPIISIPCCEHHTARTGTFGMFISCLRRIGPWIRLPCTMTESMGFEMIDQSIVYSVYNHVSRFHFIFLSIICIPLKQHDKQCRNAKQRHRVPQQMPVVVENGQSPNGTSCSGCQVSGCLCQTFHHAGLCSCRPGVPAFPHKGSVPPQKWPHCWERPRCRLVECCSFLSWKHQWFVALRCNRANVSTNLGREITAFTAITATTICCKIM